MSLFSRNKDPVEPVRADEVPFEPLRRSPRDPARSSRRSSARSSARSVDDPEVDAAAPLDPAHAAKTRARRRLIGAIALALAAVVFVPMLFDRTQVPPADDIAVQIPDRDTPFEGRRAVPDPNKGPLRPSSSLPSSPPSSVALNAAPGTSSIASTDGAPPPIAAIAAPKGVIPTEPAPENPADKPAPKAAEKNVERANEKPPERNVENTHEKTAEKKVEKTGEKGGAAATVAQVDDPRALAALEGKAVPHAGSESPSGKGFAVQIAAFSAADKAKHMRDQLSANGLKAYTESLSTPQGLRTRVRLGPFPSREAAERARQKLRTMKLDGSVVTL